MRFWPICILMLTVAGCISDSDADNTETITGSWKLTQIKGQAYDGPADMTIAADGRISGSGGCNRFSGQNKSTYPAFSVQGVAATRRACVTGMTEEGAYFQALEATRTVALANGVLTFFDETGQAVLVFTELQG